MRRFALLALTAAALSIGHAQTAPQQTAPPAAGPIVTVTGTHTIPPANTYPCKVTAPAFAAVYDGKGSQTVYHSPYAPNTAYLLSLIPECKEPPVLK